MQRERGTTLLEMTFAISILAVVVLVTMMLMNTISSGVAVEQQSAESMDQGGKVLEEVTRLMEEAMIPNDWAIADTGADSVRFLVPVDADGDGDVLDLVDGEIHVSWGARREDYSPADFTDESHETAGSAASFYTTLRFVETSTFQENSRNLDLNRDGDTDDEYSVGHLEKVYSAGTSATRGITAPEQVLVLTPDIVLLQKPISAASTWPDVDGDGQSDPLFWQDGTTLRVTLFLARVTAQTPILEKITTAVEMRNM